MKSTFRKILGIGIIATAAAYILKDEIKQKAQASKKAAAAANQNNDTFGIVIPKEED